jgi:hypothetical protein
MDGAWVGPLYWIQWAGGHRRLHPRGRRTGPGGAIRLPDCALRTACTERVRSCLSIPDLAEYRPRLPQSKTASTTVLKGALGVLGERFGGAFTS